MKVSRFALACAVLIFTAAVFANAAVAQKIAVVNPARVFNEMQETADLKKSMEAERKGLETDEFAKRQAIKDLQAKRDLLKPDSSGYAEANQALLKGSIEFEIWGRTQQAQLQGKQKVQMMNLFLKIESIVAEIAKAKQIDLVIAEQKPEFPDNLDALTVDQLRALINTRNVLYNSAAVDLTNDVIAGMDAKYKSGK